MHSFFPQFEGEGVVFSNTTCLSFRSLRTALSAGWLPGSSSSLLVSVFSFSVWKWWWSFKLQRCFSNFSQASPELIQRVWKATLENLLSLIYLTSQDLKTIKSYWDLSKIHIWVWAYGVKNPLFLVDLWGWSEIFLWELLSSSCSILSCCLDLVIVLCQGEARFCLFFYIFMWRMTKKEAKWQATRQISTKEDDQLQEQNQGDAWQFKDLGHRLRQPPKSALSSSSLHIQIGLIQLFYQT